ncbi:hypothetical protein [Agaribacterium haliotis]|uniref:hypothetical protein n=1 Tax=Agaribacterium haliotis TaxID=2013869 RepID=UPI001178ACA4|nr:hypothetical protein [Agaribacterium haliotis]
MLSDTFLAAAFAETPNSERPSLHLKAGETLELAARAYHFQNVLIEPGAALVLLPEACDWLSLKVDNNCIVHGDLICRQFMDVMQAPTLDIDAGLTLSYAYNLRLRSGAGGGGGALQAPSGELAGGRGAPGSRYAGGGGGAGAFVRGAQHQVGASATAARGARSQQSLAGHGGDGASQVRAMNGALLYLQVGAVLDMSLGRIVASGLNGQAGASGADVSNAFHDAPGGGGGGAVGGNGGCVVIRAAQHNCRPERIDVSGGQGGAGGAGGRCLGRAGSAAAGQGGDNGDEGFVDFLSCS